MNLVLWEQQSLCIPKKKTRKRGRGRRRNKIACVFGLPAELIISLSVFFLSF